MSKYSIGIDLGGTKVLTAIVNKETGEVVSYEKKKTKKRNRYVKTTKAYRFYYGRKWKMGKKTWFASFAWS